MAISDRFKSLVERAQVSSSTLAVLKTHADEIEIRLSKIFKLISVKNYGSHSRGTAIAKFSDMDMFYTVSSKDFMRGGSLMSSDSVLSKFRAELQGRYPQSSVGRDGQAIVIEFSDKTKLDIVPAVFSGINVHKKPTLLIPNGTGGWLPTSPEAHNSFIKDVHSSSGYKFSSAVQLVKIWRDNRAGAVPISSFHMELLFASKKTFAGVKPYSQCLRDAFAELNARKCAALTDPLGISGWVHACGTTPKLEAAKAAVAYALDKADRALQAEANRDSKLAGEYWGMVFNGGFPAI